MKTLRSIFLPILLLIASPVHAQWSTDPNNNLVVATSVQGFQAISDQKGGAIIVYYTGGRLHVQKLDRYGYKLWGDDGVLLECDGDYQPGGYACADGTGGCIIEYKNNYLSYPSTFSKLFAQRLDSLGNTLWNSAGVPICTVDSSFSVTTGVVSDGSSGYFLAWQYWENWPMNAYSRLFGQHIDQNGAIDWIENGIAISDPTNYSNTNPRIIAGETGSILAFWHMGIYDIQGQKVNLSGDFLWGETGIQFPSNMGGFSPRTRYISDGYDGAIVTSGQGFGILGGLVYTQRVNGSGQFLWGNEGVAICDTIIHYAPSYEVAVNETGAYYIWKDGEDGFRSTHIQHVSMDGIIQWSESGMLASATVNDIPEHQIFSCSNSEIIAGWEEKYDSTYILQKYDEWGNSLWEGGGTILTTNLNGLNDMTLVSDGAGGTIAIWTTYPDVLYAQQVSADGNLGEVLAVRDDPVLSLPTQITLHQNYPNPFNESTIISFHLPAAGEVESGIFDIAGSNVGEQHAAPLLSKQWYPAGHHQLTFNAANLSSGIYFYRISTEKYTACRKMVLVK